MDFNKVIKLLYETKEDIEAEKALSISLEEFWKENRTDEEDIAPASPWLKRSVIGVCSVFGAVIVVSAGVFAFEKINNRIQQESLYKLAVSEMKAESYPSAISHFEGIEEKNKHYYEARSYIHKLSNVERYLKQAQEFYEKDELAYALEKVNSISIIVTDYKPAKELKSKIMSRMEIKKGEADNYIKKGLELAKVGDFAGAKKQLDLCEHIYPNYIKAEELKVKISAQAVKLSQNAEAFYSGLKIPEAYKANEAALSLEPNLNSAIELRKKLKTYDEAVELAEKAATLMLQRKYDMAKQVMEQAIEKNNGISKAYEPLIQQIKDSEKIVEAVNAFKEKIKISDVSFINSGTEAEPQITAMLCLENLTDEVMQFNAFWCSLANGDNEIMPTPYSPEQMSIVAKVTADGLTQSELENDYFYLNKNEKYKILLKFEGSKEALKNSVLYYCDYNQTVPLKIDLAVID